MKVKKVFASLLICILTISTFAGCSTIKEGDLIKNAFPKNISSVDYRILVALEGTVDTGENVQNIILDSDIHVKQSDNIDFSEGKINLSLNDKKASKYLEQYNDYDNKFKYVFDPKTESFVKENLDIQKHSLSFPDENLFENLTLNKNRDENALVITSKASASVFPNIINKINDAISFANVNIDNTNYDVTFEFDSDTKNIDKIYFSLDDPNKETQFTKLNISVEFNQFDNVEIILPEIDEVVDGTNEEIKNGDNFKLPETNKEKDSTSTESSDSVLPEQTQQEFTSNVEEGEEEGPAPEKEIKKQYFIGSYNMDYIRSILPPDVSGEYDDEELLSVLLNSIENIRETVPEDTAGLKDEEVLEVLFVMSGYMDEDGNIINIDNKKYTVNNNMLKNTPKLSLNKTNIEFPISISDLKKAGFVLKDTKEWDECIPNVYTYVNVYLIDKNGNTICASVKKENNVGLDDSQVDYVSITNSEDKKDSSLEIDGIEFGATVQDVKDEYKEPFSEFFGNSYSNLKYKMQNGLSINFSFNSNVLDNIIITNAN